MTDAKSGLSRRTVIKGAAWSVPVIAAATAVPMAAASTTPGEVLDFYVTAYNVAGQGSSFGYVEANGIRISPRDSDNLVIAAGTVYTITISYTGTNEDFSFLKTANGVDWQISQVTAPGGWNSVDVQEDSIVLTYVTPFDNAEPTAPGFHWDFGPAGQVVRPEEDSIKITGVAVIAPGGDFPDGGTMAPLTIDPNGGTGSLTGPGPHGDGGSQTWPVA